MFGWFKYFFYEFIFSPIRKKCFPENVFLIKRRKNIFQNSFFNLPKQTAVDKIIIKHEKKYENKEETHYHNRKNNK